MGIKFDEKTRTWEAFFCKRHPISRQPKNFKRIGLKSEAEAKRVERELVVLLDRAFEEKTYPMWPKLVHEYMASKRLNEWTEKTTENCRLCLEAHTFEVWKTRRINSITSQEISKLLNERVGHRSPSHQQTLLKFIRGAFEFAVDSGFIQRNPAPKRKFKVNDKIKQVLTEPQIKQLLEKAKEFESEWYYHWTLAVYTGMRNGELYALTWDKVNLDQRQILVDCSWNSKDGFKSTKSGDDRLVEIAPSLVTVLKELKIHNFDSHFVLPRSRDWTKGEQARILRMFLQGIGLPQVRFHDLRASWATVMLSKGIVPLKVMSMGGWVSLKTMQIYIRKAGVDIKGITDNLELHSACQSSGQVVAFKRGNGL